MKAPADALWRKVKAAVEPLGIDADEVVLESWRGGKAMLRPELVSLGVWSDALRKNKNSTAKKIACELEKLTNIIGTARAGVQDLKKKHWSRQGLYQNAEKKLDAAIGALMQAADILLAEHGVLRAAPDNSAFNAKSSEAVFRGHALRIWCGLGGEKLQRAAAIDFLMACEALVLGEPKRDAIQKWLARNWRTADTSH
jgi:hypothetical protein